MSHDPTPLRSSDGGLLGRSEMGTPVAPDLPAYASPGETGSPRGRSLRSSPGAWQIVAAITSREIGIAAKRKLVRLLFLGSILPPIILTVIILVRIFMEQLHGAKLGFDPLLAFLQVQVLPVTLLAFGLGTSLVAQDRAEGVLFLYATRPVQPWHYALGKMLTVALPCFALLLVPGLLIAILRLGVTREFGLMDAGLMVAKIGWAGLLVAWGFAGLTVGPSAMTKRARWAQLLSFALFVIPGAIVETIGKIAGWELPPVGPFTAISEVLDALFDDGRWGATSSAVLLAYGAIGFAVTTLRVKREMIP